MTGSNSTNVKFIALNCHGFKSNFLYINNIVRLHDCIHLSETWLTQSEAHLIHITFQPANKQNFGRPFGGTILFLRKKTFSNTATIFQEDFMTTIKTTLNNRSLIITGVYLQSVNSKSDCKETYKNQLSSITGILNQFSATSECIILGDFQSCPSEPITQRSTSPNALSDYLSEFITENYLAPIDLTHGHGPAYTYHHASLPHKSYIDHFLISQSLFDLFIDTHVTEPNAINTGDHLAIKLTMNFPSKPSQNNEINTETLINDFIPNHIWKNSEFIKLYKEKVAEKIANNTSDSDIESMINNLNDILHSSASECYTTFKKDFYEFPAKNWWNDELTKAKRNLQLCFNLWRDNQFPKSESDVSYNRYKFSRKIFRTLVKRAKHQVTVEHYVNVEKLKNVNPSSYWTKVNLLNKKKQHKLFTVNGKSTKSDISNEFGEHFDRLLNTPRIDTIDNNQSNEELKNLLHELQTDIDSSDLYISQHEIISVINKLQLGKSRDPFQLLSEHYKYATSDIFNDYLTKLINRIFHSKHIPTSLSTSIIIPLVKSHKKSLNDPNNYRGISLLPIITKILELIVLEKCPQLTDHNNSQFGFVKASSSIHAELIIQDTIRYYNNNGSPVYICSLDIEKAFDCCNWNTLFTKLLDKNIPNAILNFLIQLYMNSTAFVCYGANHSKTFSLTQGVRQGGILSPYLYNIYTEDLLTNVKSMKIGCSLPNGLRTAIIAYADDIILMSPSLKHLQSMVSLCEEHGKDNGLKFNPSKTKTQFVISGQSKLTNPKLNLQSTEINPQDTLNHLGFHWCVKNDKLSLSGHKESRISELWSVVTSLITSGIRHCHPNAIISIYNSIVLPKLLYGLELVDLTKTELEFLNRQARSSLKALFNVSKNSKNLLNKIYNIPDISTLLEERKLKLFRQTLVNSSTCSYIYDMFNHPTNNIDFSFVRRVVDIIIDSNLNLLQIIFGKNIKFKRNHHNEKSEEIELCRTLIENWHEVECRISFKSILEKHVQRARTSGTPP